MMEWPVQSKFMPSEIDRLVLGYLKQEGCNGAAEQFLRESSHLGEYKNMMGKGFSAPLTIGGRSLIQLLALCQVENAEMSNDCEQLWQSLDNIVGQLKSFQASSTVSPTKSADSSRVRMVKPRYAQKAAIAKPQMILPASSEPTAQPLSTDVSEEVYDNHGDVPIKDSPPSDSMIQVTAKQDKKSSQDGKSRSSKSKNGSSSNNTVLPKNNPPTRPPMKIVSGSLKNPSSMIPPQQAFFPPSQSASTAISTSQNQQIEMNATSASINMTLPDDYSWSPFKPAPTLESVQTKKTGPTLITPGKDPEEQFCLQDIFPMDQVVDKLIENTDWQQQFAETINKKKQQDDAHVLSKEDIEEFEHSEADKLLSQVLSMTKDDPQFSDFQLVLQDPAEPETQETGKRKKSKPKKSSATLGQSQTCTQSVESVVEGVAPKQMYAAVHPLQKVLPQQPTSTLQPMVTQTQPMTTGQPFTLAPATAAHNTIYMVPNLTAGASNQPLFILPLPQQGHSQNPPIAPALQPGQITATTAEASQNMGFVSPQPSTYNTVTSTPQSRHSTNSGQSTPVNNQSDADTPINSSGNNLVYSNAGGSPGHVLTPGQLSSDGSSTKSVIVSPMAKNKDGKEVVTAKWSPSLTALVRSVSPKKKLRASQDNHIRHLRFSPQGGKKRRIARRPKIVMSPQGDNISSASPDLNSPQLTIDLPGTPAFSATSPSVGGSPSGMTPGSGSIYSPSSVGGPHSAGTPSIIGGRHTPSLMSPLATFSSPPSVGGSPEGFTPSVSSTHQKTPSTRTGLKRKSPKVKRARRAPIARKGMPPSSMDTATPTKANSPSVTMVHSREGEEIRSITSVTIAESTPKGKNFVPTQIESPDLKRAIASLMENSASSNQSSTVALANSQDETVDIAQALMELAAVETPTKSPMVTPTKLRPVMETPFSPSVSQVEQSDSSLMPPPQSPAKRIRTGSPSTITEQRRPGKLRKMKKRLKSMSMDEMLAVIHK